ncbi:hypothetical protein JCGZ_04313 [Jatropha curcas]|uniref:Uncharacterized protein n=1 Tax=Jatropha curcas TaxID=180498 RepID=A0A067KTT5_JATCU|nr:hypothetical protein JCGZ_04313 [Jatropha curcas]
MANAKFNFSIALIIALVLSHGISSTEQRVLKEMREASVSSGSFNFHRNILVELEGDSDDFRPTNPGHSPGAGHSNGPSSASIAH